VDVDALAAGVEGVAGGLELRLASAAEDDAGALVEEAPRRGLADAAATPGDDDHLVLEAHAVPPFVRPHLVHVHQYTCRRS
jgi:hypothetical protein